MPFSQPTWSRRILGAVLFLGALFFARWGEKTMKEAGTNVRPDRPSTAIVDDGPFRYTRNPLYLSVATMFVGIAQMANSAWFLLLLVPMLLVLHFGVERREERYMEAKFAEPYRAYRARVRRYL
jgi:protein-S-isoprenylcysteine O-methyltransferase Ste14